MASFQRKCLGKMGEVNSQGRTVLFVTHNMTAMLALCSRAALLEKGKLVAVGDPAAIAARYEGQGAGSQHFQRLRLDADSRAIVTEIRVESARSGHDQEFQRADGVRIQIEIEVRSQIENGQVAVGLLRSNGVHVLTTTSLDAASLGSTFSPGRLHCEVTIPCQYLVAGDYRLNTVIGVAGGEFIDVLREVVAFTVTDPEAIDIRLGGPTRDGVVAPVLPWQMAHSS